jgi:tol-pal system protein YbgF
MKKLSALLLWSLSSMAFAELAPVIDNSSYPSGAPAVIPVQANTSVNNTYELMTRLDEAQNEIQQLNGKIEEQTNLIAELKKKQSIMYSDFDDRLQQMETKMNSNKSNVATESSTPKEKEQEAEVPAPKSVSPAVTPSSGQSTDGDKKQQYTQAYDAFRNGQTLEAITQFNALLSKDPNNQYANNAQYWLGEAYRVNKNTDAARKAFNLVIEKYPNSAKVPDAILRLGLMEMEQRNTAKAKDYFTRVITDFPSSPSSQIAAKKLQQFTDVKN